MGNLPDDPTRTKWQAIPQPDGSWLIKEPSEHVNMGEGVIGTKGGKLIARVCGDENVSLLMAAPELLEACQACIPRVAEGLAADLLRAAIAKATGQA